VWSEARMLCVCFERKKKIDNVFGAGQQCRSEDTCQTTRHQYNINIDDDHIQRLY
jgi:hypothetical protein